MNRAVMPRLIRRLERTLKVEWPVRDDQVCLLFVFGRLRGEITAVFSILLPQNANSY